MTTREITKALQQNSMIRQVVPEWAYRTVPYPFRRNDIPHLGFYFYPLKKQDGKAQILPPILQAVTVYPTGHIVSLAAAPFFLNRRIDQENPIGEYPGAAMKSL